MEAGGDRGEREREEKSQTTSGSGVWQAGRQEGRSGEKVMRNYCGECLWGVVPWEDVWNSCGRLGGMLIMLVVFVSLLRTNFMPPAFLLFFLMISTTTVR